MIILSRLSNSLCPAPAQPSEFVSIQSPSTSATRASRARQERTTPHQQERGGIRTKVSDKSTHSSSSFFLFCILSSSISFSINLGAHGFFISAAALSGSRGGAMRAEASARASE